MILLCTLLRKAKGECVCILLFPIRPMYTGPGIDFGTDLLRAFARSVLQLFEVMIEMRCQQAWSFSLETVENLFPGKTIRASRRYCLLSENNCGALRANARRVHQSQSHQMTSI